MVNQENVEWAKCLVDPAYFLDTYGRIEDRHSPDGLAPLVPFRLWPAQVKLMWQFTLHRLVIILKARQLGISWLVCGYALWLCLFNPGKLVLCFSKTEGDAQELLRRIMVMYNGLPQWMRDRAPKLVRFNTVEAVWDNTSRIESKAATKNAGRGDTASLIVLDEFAFMLYAASVFTAVKPTMDAGGQMIVCSTADGIGNPFHSLYQSAKAGVNGFLPVFLSYLARPGREGDWKEQKRRESLEPLKIAQEYPETDTEAFLASANARFDRSWIEAQKKTVLPSIPIDEALRNIPGVKQWKRPEPGRAYGIGADVAEGGEGGDWDDASVLDLDTLEEVAAIRGKWEPGVFAGYLDAIATHYNRAKIWPERNNHGHTVIWQLRQLGASVGYGHDKKYGWLTNSITKPQLIDHYAGILKDSVDGDGLVLHDENGVAEAAIFEHKADGSTGAPEGQHDDGVISRAIAVFAAKRLGRRFGGAR